jgi:hypothetical protein
MNSKLTLTYDSENIVDSTGAHLQRIFGIYALSKFFRIQYLHSGIKKLLVQPLDPFQTDTEILNYLNRVNEEYNLPSKGDFPKKFDIEITVIRMTLKKIVKLKMRAFFQQKMILVKVQNPNLLAERFHKSYLHVRDYFESAHIKDTVDTDSKNIVLHIRRGSNGGDILPGELSPRMLSNRYYLSVLESIVHEYCNGSNNICLTIITDVPTSDIVFQPIAIQKELWASEPRLINGGVEIKGDNFSEFGIKELSGFEVLSGGDPLIAITKMREADFFVMSRSSLSYIGGILNSNGVIFYPPNFWHKPLPGWVKVN